MSFDVFFQRFRHGAAESGGSEAMHTTFAPHIERPGSDESLVHVVVGDGGADIYLSDDAMLANHITGEQTWDLLVEAAKAAGCSIMPVGCPVLITDESGRAHLPDGLREDAVHVLTGQDVRRVISES